MSTTAQRGVDRFGLVALVGSGTFAAHELGYLAEGPDTVSHAYFGVVGPVVLLTACVAAWLAAVRVLRDDPGRRPSLAALAAAQAAVYVVVEVAERLVGGGTLASLASAPVVLGLLAQPLVAWAALRLLRLGRELIERFRAASPGALRRPLVDTPTPVAVYVTDPSCARLRLRGPPV